MGGIYVKDPVPDNAMVERYGAPSLSSGVGFGTAFEEQWIRNPFSPFRHQELIEAEAGTEMPETGPVDQPIPPLFMNEPVTPEARKLTPQEANDRFGIPGELSWDQPVRAAQAQLQARWKREELKRQNILSRSTPGVLPGLARLSAGFLASAVDPLNIASAFIPVVGEARFAALVGRVGLTPARLARGATEGLVGAAVVEPLVYLQAQSEQADYDAYDSLLNLAFGTALGGGLHAGFGKISDWIKGQPIELREIAHRGAMAAILEDRPVRVAEVMAPEGMVMTTTPVETPVARDTAPVSAAAVADETQGVPAIGQENAITPGIRLAKQMTLEEYAAFAQAETRKGIERRLADYEGIASGAIRGDRGARGAWALTKDQAANLAREERAKLAEVDTKYSPEAVRELYEIMRSMPDDPPRRADPARVIESQRQTYEPTPDQAAQAKNTEALAEGWDQPITPEQGAEEAAELIEATNEAHQMAKKDGVLTDQDEAGIKGDPETEKAAKEIAAGREALVACLVRAA